MSTIIITLQNFANAFGTLNFLSSNQNIIRICSVLSSILTIIWYNLSSDVTTAQIYTAVSWASTNIIINMPQLSYNLWEYLKYGLKGKTIYTKDKKKKKKIGNKKKIKHDSSETVNIIVASPTSSVL